MSEAMVRALLGACGHTGGTVVATKAPQAAGAPPQRPHAPYGAMTTGEADAWRAGWAAHEAATLRLVSPRYPSLAAQVVMIPMPEPMREPTGLEERGA